MTSRMVASASLTGGQHQLAVGAARLRVATTPSCAPIAGVHTDREAAQFLILDARFPRSIMHGLRRRRGAACEKVTLAQPDAGAGSRGPPARGARASFGPGWSTPTSTTCWTTSDDEMTGVQDVCADVTATVSTNFFAAADPTAWITEGTR